jgi:aminopeptidase N
MKGAFFYRKVAATIGADKLDAILAKFYALHQGSAASMGDMVALIGTEGGFDPSALATRYLQSLGNPEL